MTETEGTAKKTRPIDVLKQRRGGMTDALKQRVKEQGQIRKQMRESLKTGSKTVPQIASECKIPSDKAMWHLMAMKRYGDVVEDREENGYIKYQLKEA
jgi:hypothetical protein